MITYVRQSDVLLFFEIEIVSTQILTVRVFSSAFFTDQHSQLNVS